jgi:chromosome partitioning protein
VSYGSTANRTGLCGHAVAVDAAVVFDVFAALEADAEVELEPQPASARLASASESAAFFIVITPVVAVTAADDHPDHAVAEAAPSGAAVSRRRPFDASPTRGRLCNPVVLATYNIKGGVGKTSAAVNLAYLAARAGATTLLWDLDPQGGSTYLLRIKPKVKGGGRRLVRGKSDAATRIKGTDYERLDLLPADFSYRHMDLDLDSTKSPTRRLGRVLAPLVPDYDYVFLDCPPSISLVSESVFEAADALLIPLLPATLSARTLDYIEQVAGPDVQRLAFFSMVDARKRMHRDVMDAFTAERPEMLHAVVPLAADVERMGTARAPLEEFAPHGRAAEAFRELWAEVCERLARRASLH